MFVPPFFPPPLEVRSNVADGPNKTRLQFVRRVLFGFNASFLFVAGGWMLIDQRLIDFPKLPSGPASTWLLLLLLLGLLAGLRNWPGGQRRS
jgi:MYXO-CTERM domain-containing protein